MLYKASSKFSYSLFLPFLLSIPFENFNSFQLLIMWPQWKFDYTVLVLTIDRSMPREDDG